MFLLQMSGVPGSGKSTVAAHVVKTFGAVAIDYDVLKSAALDAGLDVPTSAKTSYETMYGLARHLLSQGHPVILDSPCNWPRIVAEGMEIAEAHGATYRYIECQTSDLTLLEARLSQRPRLRSHRRSLSLPPPDLGDTPEEGRALYQAWMTQPHRPPTPYLQVDTCHPLSHLLQQIDTYLKQ